MKYQRGKGRYFLFTLGFLLVFSSGFFAFLAWEGPGYQGSVAALEQPVLPPSLDSVPGKKNDPKVHAVGKPAATLESPESQPMTELVSGPASQPASLTEPLPPTNPQEASPKGNSLGGKKERTAKADSQGKAEKIASPTGHGVQSLKTVEAAKDTKPSADKPRKKSRKPVRIPPVVVDETKVPPEWDWFATPLRLSMTDHRVTIVADVGQVSSKNAILQKSVSEARTDESEVPPAKQEARQEPGPEIESAKDLESSPTAVPVVSADEHEAFAKRLNNILVRLQERREKRLAEARARALILPSARCNVKTGETIGNDVAERLDASETAVATTKDGTSIPREMEEGLPPLNAESPSGEAEK
ncbi:MAG TPA: hypothetical protein PLU72_07865 [Candidatus Ozemobacteraceae bacterium]|nr:hypothetical protein [Candidatus Ozemobacteraceae bacterium]